jgi:hypothetical protein
MDIVLYVMLASLAFVAMMVIRNYWVHKNIDHIIETNYEAFKKLPEYEYILFRFWIWNFKKFIK